MSRFDNSGDDTPPTRLIRNKQKTEASPPALDDDKTEQYDSTKKIELDFPEPAPQNQQGFEPEGAMGGANLGQRSTPPASTAPASGSGQKTVVFRPSGGNSPAHSIKPAVGWFVIVNGPGKGSSIEISYGHNKIGRDPSQDISLNFNDEKISRQHHAAVEFDPKLRKFYLSKGENLVYLNGDRVGAGSEHEIKTGDQIELGDTLLQFVAFCGPEFDWNS